MLSIPEVRYHGGQAYRVYDGAGVQTAVAYDFKGGQLAAERQLAVEVTQTVDWSALAELEDVTDLEAAAAAFLEPEVFRTESTYDALGRPMTQTTPDGSVVRLSYNEAALLEGVSANVRGAASPTDFVSNIDYDAKGRRTLIAYGNGTETSYSYDSITQRLTRLRTQRQDGDATRTFQDLAYTYDVVGNIVEVADAAQDDVYFGGTVVTATQRYAYDALYRLTEAEGREHAGQNASQSTEFGASPSQHPQDGTAMRRYVERYVYDVVGNILSMQHEAVGGNWTRRSQYAANGNRLEANSAPGDAAGQHSHGYSYDAHGNMTSMPHLSAVSWNYADQMRSADLGGGGTVYFVYDGAGQRVRKVRVNQAGTQTTERIYLGAFELYRERTNGTLTLERETLHVADDAGRMCDVETRTVQSSTVVQNPTTHHRYQYSNHLGSASLELTQTAEVISYEEYHPYGTSAYRAVNSSIDVSARTYRYTGKERDEETGLGYHGARYYACWLGRWTASDPIGLGDGVNRYAYVSGNPISYVDGDGQRKTPAQMAALRAEVAQIRQDAIAQAQKETLAHGRELAQRQLQYEALSNTEDATALELGNAKRDVSESRDRIFASINRLGYAYEHGVLPEWEVARYKIAELKSAEIEIHEGNVRGLEAGTFDAEAFEKENLRELGTEVAEKVVDEFTPVGTVKDIDAAAKNDDMIAVAAIVGSEYLPLPPRLRRLLRVNLTKHINHRNHVPNLPFGYKDKPFRRFVSRANEEFADVGFDDAELLLQGSAVSRKKFSTGEALDARAGIKPSDYDVAVVSPKLLAKANELGLDVLNGPLTPHQVSALGLTEAQNALSKASKGGISVEFKVYETVDDVYEYGQTTPFSLFAK